MTPLPMADPCADCGLCCRHVGTPPGFFAAYCSPHWDGKFLTESEDYATWLAMPAAVRDELRAYYDAVDRGEVADRARDEVPCLWFDAATKRCRNYESRPQTCREAVEPGDEYCLTFRTEGGL